MIHDTINPGTQEAIEKGCTCPVVDNHYGKGAPCAEGDGPHFWYTQGCPLLEKQQTHGRTPDDDVSRAVGSVLH